MSRVKALKKSIHLLLALLMAAALLSGCASGQPSQAPAASGTAASGTAAAATAPVGNGPVDLSKPVEVVLWMTGTAPDFSDKILAKLNEYTKKDLNCTVSYNFFNTKDTQQKYLLVLSSGQPIDLLYSANYLNYAANALKGAFQKLDDMVPKYSPALWEYVGSEGWNAARVNGGIYMIPCIWKEYNLFAFTYREDLRVKHNLPLPDSIANIELYLQGIKDNEPDIMPTGEVVQASVGNLGTYFRAFEVFDSKYKWIDWRMPYGLFINYDDPTQVNCYWESADFRDDMKLLKKWADAGFWSKNALSNKEDPKEAMLAGKIAAQVGTAGYGSGISYTKEAKTTAPDTTMVFASIPYSYAKKQTVAVHPTQNGFSVPITAANPDRAIAFYEKLVLDKAYFNLTQYGIEGEDYKVVNNAYVEIKGGLKREAMRLWACRNDALYLPTEDNLAYEPFKAKFKEYEGPNKYGGFIEDSTPYTAERAALMEVVAQYLVPLQAGLVADVDTAVDEFLTKAKAAGMAKLQTEYIKQWQAYVQANNAWK